MSVWLEVAAGPGEGTEVEVEPAGIVIGREGDVDLAIADAGVSRRHARVEVHADGSALITDLGSSNGTYVNAEPVVGTVRLSDGDRITVGGATVEVHDGEGAATEVVGAGATEQVAPPPRMRPPERREPDPHAEPRYAEPPQPYGGPVPASGGGFNYAAIGAIVCGPLSILLVVLASGTAFYASLPIAVAGIVLGSTGKRQVDSGRVSGLRAVALAGQVFSVVGVVLSTLLIALLLIFNQVVDGAADSLEGLIDEVRSEIEGIPLPEDLQS